MPRWRFQCSNHALTSYNAGMVAGLRNRKLLIGLVLGHLLAAAAVDYFGFHWRWGARYSKAPLPIRCSMDAAHLIIQGADIALLGVWAALSRHRRTTRAVVATLCILCWCVIYHNGWPFAIRAWLMGWYRWEHLRHYFFYNSLKLIGSLPILVVLGVVGALNALMRGAVRLERVDQDARQHESGSRQFHVSHLLLFVSIVSVLLAICVDFHSRLSREISMRWAVEDAPVYCVETVMLSVLVLVAITLSLVWAALSKGRPGLRLFLATVSAGLLGAGWAYAFTAPKHAQYLLYNALFSSCVGLGQALLIGGVLLLVRRRGYRLMRR